MAKLGQMVIREGSWVKILAAGHTYAGFTGRVQEVATKNGERVYRVHAIGHLPDRYETQDCWVKGLSLCKSPRGLVYAFKQYGENNFERVKA